MNRQKTWREQHPLLFGLCSTFGIFPVHREIPSTEQTIQDALDDIESAIAEVKRKHPEVS